MGAALAGVLALAAIVSGQERAFDEKTLKAAGQGRAVYLANCADCHGNDARGGFVNESGARTPDLTLIALRDGQFDRNHVSLHIDGRWLGRQGEMPRWGRAFAQSHPGREGWAGTRLYVLTRYLDVIQEPGATR